jgi:hypothetical protein
MRGTCKISGGEGRGLVREEEEKRNGGKARDVRVMAASFMQSAVDGESRGRRGIDVVGVEGILSSDREKP